MITEEQKKHTADSTALDKAIRVYIQRINKTSPVKIKTEALTFSDFFENKM